MPHPATQAVERYYTLFNEKDWPGITAMFDLPATTPIKTWNCSYTLRLVGADWLFTLITSDDVGDAKASPTSAST